MMSIDRRSSAFVSITVVLACLVVGSLARGRTPMPKTVTPLTEYVYNPDRHYRWNVSSYVIKADGYTAYNVFLTSQQWLTAAESDSSIWHHWLQVCVPDKLVPNADYGYLYIDGGHTPDFNNPPTSLDMPVARICKQTNTIGAALYAIPNEPIVFTGDPGNRRSEDAMIAYTWSHFINNTLEPDWLARMPMTKASIRALDAMQEFVATLPGSPKVPTKFAIAGASKRGWTAWMVGAMGDPRVVALVPIVAPVANLVPQINEMWESYGNWSFALKDYTDMGLMGFLNLPVFAELLHIIDPLTYLPEMSVLPKYVIVAAGDEFFMPDAAQYYWNQLPGEKYLRIVPNAEHSLAGHVLSVIDGIVEYYLSLMNEDLVRPTYSWTISADGGTITLTTSSTKDLVSAKVYMSNNTKARDWRLITCAEKSPHCLNPRLWHQKMLTESSPGVFTYTHAMPTEGWSAFFIELEYKFNTGVHVFTVTSDMSIIPKQMPYKHCGADVCYCAYRCPAQLPPATPTALLQHP